MTTPPADSNHLLLELARIVRYRRLASRMTLQQLGARCGLSQSMLSKIENGKLSPTYERIVALANGLSLQPAELFADKAASRPIGRLGITRNGSGALKSTSKYEYRFLCTEILNKAFQPLHTVIKARAASGGVRLSQHAGAEFVHVLSGAVTLHSEYYEPIELQTGDSIYFDSSMRHALACASAEDSVVLWVCSEALEIS